MGWKDVFAENLLVRWLSGRRAAVDLAVSMTGVRLGERVLQVGVGDGRLLAALAGKVGYTGQVLGVDADASALAGAERAAARSGVLVDLQHGLIDQLAPRDGAFDLAVLSSATAGDVPSEATLQAVLRWLRGGGRCLVVMHVPRHAPWTRTGRRPAPAEILPRLTGAGFRAARLLAEREGMAFVEAMKAP